MSIWELFDFVICVSEKRRTPVLFIMRSSEMETDKVYWPVALPVKSRFFDRPVKPVETPLKFSVFATKRPLSTYRNINIITHKFFYKKNAINKPSLLKTLVEWFQTVTDIL